jgi:hypothetical protein
MAMPQSPAEIWEGGVRLRAAAALQRLARGGVVTEATVRLGDSQLRVQGRPLRVTLSNESNGRSGGASNKSVEEPEREVEKENGWALGRAV